MSRVDLGHGHVRPMTKADAPEVLRWRNHPDIRRYMYTSHEITPEEHDKWFQTASVDETKTLLVFVMNTVRLGFASFSIVGPGRVADWGFYVAPEAPAGTGRRLGGSALNYGFGRLGLHKVCGKALAFNERSIRFHLKMGFQREGMLRDQHFDGVAYHTVICFGLLRAEWRRAIQL